MPAKGLLRDLRQSLVDALEKDIAQAESYAKVGPSPTHFVSTILLTNLE